MTESGYKRKLAAILYADVQEYSRLMGEDEDGTVRALKAHLQVVSGEVGKYRGRVVDATGDNFLAEFASAVDAVKCAVEIQEAIRSRNEVLPENRRMAFRLGINIGDVIEEEGRIYGDGVNIAARIGQAAEGGGICISGTVYDQVKNRLPLGFEFLGEHSVKNIADPVRVYKVISNTTGPGIRQARPPVALHRRNALLVVATGTIVAALAAFLWNADEKPSPLPVQVVVDAPTRPPPSDRNTGTQSEAPGTARRKPPVASPAEKAPAAIPGGNRSPQSSPPREDVVPVASPGPPLPDEASIAILPFENLSGDPGQEYLSDGFTDDLITSLSLLPRIFLIARSSTSTYKGKPANVIDVSRDLGVRYVLEGSIQRTENRLRVNAQLLDGTTGRHVWAERYDRNMGDLFEIEDNVILEIATALSGKLTDGEVSTFLRRDTKNLSTWEALQRARALYERYSPEDNLRARDLFRKVVEAEPTCFPGKVYIGWTYYQEGKWAKGAERDQAFQKTVETGEELVRISPASPSGYMLLSFVQSKQGKHEESIANGRRALELAPHNDIVAAGLAAQLNFSGEPEEAIALMKRAIRQNPFHKPWYLHTLGLSYHLTGRHREAIEVLKKASEKEEGSSDSIFPHVRLAAVYADLGREEEMRAEAAEVLRINPKYSLKEWMKTEWFKDPKIAERRRELLLKAGLPE